MRSSIDFNGGEQKPSSFVINKGVVSVINDQTQTFWVQYASNDARHININSGQRLEINIDQDNIKLSINIANLPQCNVHLTAGMMNVYGVCQDSKFNISAGTLTVHVSRDNVGTVHGYTNVGMVSNSSNLAYSPVVSHHIGWFGVSEFSDLCGMGGINQDVYLQGSLLDYYATFSVDSGMLNFSY